VGIEAAKAAGMYAVGLTTTVKAMDLLEAVADQVVTNLVGYDVSRLLDHLASRAAARG
jgi:beta-phosphoglucomutase-like phosphatase (HAD superfamily)